MGRVGGGGGGEGGAEDSLRLKNGKMGRVLTSFIPKNIIIIHIIYEWHAEAWGLG